MGEGRQISFLHSTGSFVIVVDTDVVYSPLLRRFVFSYLEGYSQYSVQALYVGIFPREHWIRVGGRRSLNTNEDVDMWLRLWRFGLIRWYSVSLGSNLKEAGAVGSSDYLSKRYSPSERARRLIRREWDLLKTRDIQRTHLAEVIALNTVDLGLGPVPQPWPQDRTPRTTIQHIVDFARDLKQTLGTR